MMKLKLGPIPDDKPVRLTIILSAELAALLRTYADAVGSGISKPVTVERIVPHILERFIRTDRVFMRTRRQVAQSTARSTESESAAGGAKLILRRARAGNLPSDIEKSTHQPRWRVDVMLQSDCCVARVGEQRSHDRAEARDQY